MMREVGEVSISFFSAGCFFSPKTNIAFADPDAVTTSFDDEGESELSNDDSNRGNSS